MQRIDNKILTASQVLLLTLKKLGVGDIFGYPGSSVLGVYDELSKQQQIRHYLMQSEQSAVHAAEGYSRAGGKCGCVLVTAGPGALNTVTGIANAYLDGSPLIVIAGDINSELAGRDSFQEINFPEIIKPCSKSVFKITEAEELESTILQAYLIATTGKKGPVVVDIPSNIFSQNTEYKDLGLPFDKVETVSEVDISRAVEILKNAKSPLIVCGGGVVQADASDELSALATLLEIPVVTTMMGVGAFPESEALCAGMIGVYGHKLANTFVEKADALLVLGARFNDRVVSAFDIDNLKSKTIIQVDINSKELIRNLSSDLAVNADIKMFLNAMLTKISDTNAAEFNYSYNVANSKLHTAEDNENLTIKNIVTALSRFTKDFAPVVASDVGQHQIALVKNYGFNMPRRLLVSGGLGTMGFGFGAAIGASVALGKKPVILFTGDGSFQMNMPELAVCKRYGIPVKVFVVNNGQLGMVRQLQDELYEGRHFATALSNPDFVILAESYGITAERVKNPKDINGALERAFSHEEPYLVEFVTRGSENV